MRDLEIGERYWCVSQVHITLSLHPQLNMSLLVGEGGSGELEEEEQISSAHLGLCVTRSSDVLLT